MSKDRALSPSKPHRASKLSRLACCLLSAIFSCTLGPDNARAELSGLKFLDDLGSLCQGDFKSERDPYDERIETERHDFTQSTKTVGAGVVQVEAGYSYFYKDEDDEIEETHTGPEMLWRIGLSDDIEFRLRWNYAWRLLDDVEERDGAQDLIWSVKLGISDHDGCRPESALEIRSTAPTGGNDWSTDIVDFGLDYIYGWRLTETCELYGSTGFGTNGLGDVSLVPDEPADDRFTVWSQSVALGTEVSESNTVYLEYFGIFSHALADEFSLNFFNIGVDHYVTNDFVIDVRAGVGLSSDSEDFFGGAGGGYRF